MGTASLIYRRYHSVALSQAGDVYTWGMNYLGQLGLLDTIQRLVPTKVKKSQPGQLFIAFIAAGTFRIQFAEKLCICVYLCTCSLLDCL